MKSNSFLYAFARFAVCFLAMAVLWMMVKEGMGIQYSSTLGTALKLFGDCAIALSWFWLLPRRFRWLGLVPVWAFAAWGVCNLAYFRFWKELIPAASITMTGNVDANLMEYASSLLKWSDLGFLIVPAVATAIYVVFRRLGRFHPAESGASKPRWMAFAACLGLGLLGQASYFKTTWAWRNSISPRDFKTALLDHYAGGFSEYHRLYAYTGPVCYTVRYLADVVGVLNSTITLNKHQRKEIALFLKQYERHGGRVAVADSLNVVYIIVESLNADMVRKRVGERKLMPVLDSLSRLDGTVWIDNVRSQTRASSSSDGHLLLLTGLMPPEKISYSIAYGATGKFPSLADYMPRHTKALLLADDGVCWNEGNTLRNFGLGDPLTTLQRDEADIEALGRDGAMFRQAAEIVRTLPRPFFMTLMTISMHIPFKEAAWPLPRWIEEDADMTQMEKDYANTCLHTDRYIGEFLKNLPANTIIFISSDHHQAIASDGSDQPRAMMMAIHTGLTSHISRPVGQANLFPATLDLLGIEGGGYGGVAPSAFSEKASPEVGEALRISDLIIRGDYFRAIGR